MQPDRLVADHVERLVPYSPGKPVEELERELGIEGAVKLASNENPVGPSPKVLEAVAAVAREANRYPDAAGWYLKEALAERLGVTQQEIALGNGSNELIDLLALAFVGPQEHVVFGEPSFVCYELACLKVGVPYTKVPLRERTSWDVEALLDAVRPETKLLYVAHPNNPTGAHVPAADLERLLRELPPRVVAVIDEAYVEFADAPDYRSAMQMRLLRERLVVLRTFSKAYGLAGFRVGFAVAPPTLVDYLNRVRAPFNVGRIAQAAALAALQDEEHVRRYVRLNAEQRARLTEELRALGFQVAPSQTNFLLVDFGVPAKALYEALLREGVIVRPMGPPIETTQRVTVGLPEENDRLLGALRVLRERGFFEGARA